MKRLNPDNLNTAEHFDGVWSQTHLHKWDREKTKALIAPVQPHDRVLEIGAGVFGACEWLALHGFKGDLRVVDFSAEAKRQVTERHPRIDWTLGDVISKGSFVPDWADVVIAGEVIEHMEDPAAFVCAMAAGCRPGGTMILSTLNTDCSDTQGMTYPEHLWEFEPDELLGFFTPHGSPNYYLIGNYHFIECRKRNP